MFLEGQYIKYISVAHCDACCICIQLTKQLPSLTLYTTRITTRHTQVQYKRYKTCPTYLNYYSATKCMERKQHCTHSRVALTRLLCILYASEEDGDEPLQRVLVHGVNVSQVRGAEEQDLRPHSHWDVPTTGDINVLLCLLCCCHFGLRQ